MANVDKELHNPEVTAGNLIKERTSSTNKRGLKGAAGGIYIGPVLSTAAIGDSSITHATTPVAGGGVEDSTGYRESDTYSADGAEGMGATPTATVRPNPGNQAFGGRNVYRSDGIQGGSVPGYPAQVSGQRSAAASGSGLTALGSAAAFIDKRSTIAGEGGRSLGGSGRGTRVLAGTVVTDGVGQASGQSRMARPTMQAGDISAAGQVQIVDGTGGAVHADLHADDITGGANALTGVIIWCYARGTDTDEDAALVRKGDFDTTTEGAVTGLSGLTAGTYAFYAAFKDAAGNVGPRSARLAVTIS